jgi:hypothetical protein
MATNVTVNGSRVSITTTEGETLRQAQQTAQTTGNPLDSLTLAQALAWIDTNVADLASARAALKHLAKLLFVMRAEVHRRQ